MTGTRLPSGPAGGAASAPAGPEGAVAGGSEALVRTVTPTVAVDAAPHRAGAGPRGAAGRRRRPAWSGATLALVPFLAFVAVFLLWPVGVVVVRAFTPGGVPGLGALVRAVSGPYRSAFENSLALAGTSAVLGGVLGLALALAVRDLTRPRWLRPAIEAWSSVASQLGGVPLAFAFVAALGTQGVVTKALRGLGVDLITSGFSLATLAGMTLVYLYFQIPLMFLVVAPAVAGLRATWREAAELMGAGPVRYWATVAGPILLPSVLGGMLLLFVNAFSAYATAYVLSSSGQLVPLQIRFVLQGNVITGEQDLGYALVTWTVALMVLGLVGMTLLQRRAARWTHA
ncbi:ABC transporter permease [Cellulomonas sp. NS3]|uniref:ABC transporter permease n=1 Tax=Cellulomonas sp. NS3 TaxID=2973977 RepID=UPI0021619477|nr:ABC transporter permease subunit [Cellulomonas sp. NS3]